MDAVEALAGVPVAVVIPACVEVVKRAGLPVRFAGLAAIGCAVTLVALADLATGATLDPAAAARWLLLGCVHGLAGAGLYSQVRHLTAYLGTSPDPGTTAGPETTSARASTTAPDHFTGPETPRR